MKCKRLVSALVALSLPLLLQAYAAAAELPQTLVPVGRTVGIRLDMKGVMVVGFADVCCDGEITHPAKDAGVETGDIIKSLNGRKIASAADFLTAASRLDDETAELTVERSGERLEISVTPKKNDSGAYQLGVWLRDGVAGVGTVTFYDPESGTFGALGHGISDSAVGTLVPVGDGSILDAEVVDVVKGECGSPGELCGKLGEEKLGEIESNTSSGIFGTMISPENHGALPVAGDDEICLGEAEILSNVEGRQIESYSIEISRIYRAPDSGRALMIGVTDPRLLSLTGGIVQGMSGSPIIQNGKLVGAVTHV